MEGLLGGDGTIKFMLDCGRFASFTSFSWDMEIALCSPLRPFNVGTTACALSNNGISASGDHHYGRNGRLAWANPGFGICQRHGCPAAESETRDGNHNRFDIPEAARSIQCLLVPWCRIACAELWRAPSRKAECAGFSAGARIFGGKMAESLFSSDGEFRRQNQSPVQRQVTTTVSIPDVVVQEGVLRTPYMDERRGGGGQLATNDGRARSAVALEPALHVGPRPSVKLKTPNASPPVSDTVSSSACELGGALVSQIRLRFHGFNEIYEVTTLRIHRQIPSNTRNLAYHLGLIHIIPIFHVFNSDPNT